MYKLIEIRHNIIIQYYGNYMIKNFNYMPEIDILRNSSQKNFGVLRGDFVGVGV